MSELPPNSSSLDDLEPDTAPEAVPPSAEEVDIPAEEIPAPAEEVPQDREVRHWFFGLLAFLLILMVAITAGGAVSLQALIEEEEAARVAWTRVSEVQDSRRRLLDDAIRLQGWLADPPDAVRRYRAALQAADTATDFDREVAAVEELDARAAELIALVGRQAEADSAGTLAVLHGRLMGAERLRRIEGDRFREAASRYCERLDRIPTRWIGYIFGFNDLRIYSPGD